MNSDSIGGRSSKTKPISLRVANKAAYLWDVDDIATLRSKHRICGVLTGTLPHLSQQNVFLGVPLVLMPEEVVLLVEQGKATHPVGPSPHSQSPSFVTPKGVAILVNDPTAHLQPTVAQLTKWSREQQNSIRSQLAYVEAKSKESQGAGGQASRALSEEAIKKRKEREERRKAKKREVEGHEADDEQGNSNGDSNGNGSGSGDAPAETDAEPNAFMISSTSTVTPAKAARLREGAGGMGSLSPISGSSPSSSSPSKPSSPAPTAVSSQPYTISIPASSSTLEWYSPSHSSAAPPPRPVSSASPFSVSPSTSTYTTLASAREAGVWTYPSTLSERARCGVFRALWEKEYYMGVGIKFGGEYLVYPGDPLRYHSHFTASVIESPISTIRPMEIVAHGRLGTATKKAHLLCGWDDETKEVSFLSIEWAGFG